MTQIRALGVFLACTLAIGLVFAQTAPKRVSFDFKGINVAQVVQLIYGEVLATAYVIDPEVLGDMRLVSFRYTSDKGDIRAFVRAFLESLGYIIKSKEGIDFITKRPIEEKREATVEKDGFVYRPQYRDVSYLARLLAPMFQGGFSVNRAISGSNVQADKP
jgi:general secretion pathway protein D